MGEGKGERGRERERETEDIYKIGAGKGLAFFLSFAIENRRERRSRDRETLTDLCQIVQIKIFEGREPIARPIAPISRARRNERR